MNKKRKEEHPPKKCEECENEYFLTRKYDDDINKLVGLIRYLEKS